MATKKRTSKKKTTSKSRTQRAQPRATKAAKRKQPRAPRVTCDLLEFDETSAQKAVIKVVGVGGGGGNAVEPLSAPQSAESSVAML